jgi:hypothetical protein
MIEDMTVRNFAAKTQTDAITCPNSGYRVQGLVPEDISEDDHVYEPVTCPVCHLIHHVNPHTGVVLGEKAALRPGSSSQ